MVITTIGRLRVDRVVAREQPDACRRRAWPRDRRTSGSTAPSAGSCRRPCRRRSSARSIANSATTVLPEPVGAATSTDMPSIARHRSRHAGTRRARRGTARAKSSGWSRCGQSTGGLPSRPTPASSETSASTRRRAPCRMPRAPRGSRGGRRPRSAGAPRRARPSAMPAVTSGGIRRSAVPVITRVGTSIAGRSGTESGRSAIPSAAAAIASGVWSAIMARTRCRSSSGASSREQRRWLLHEEAVALAPQALREGTPRGRASGRVRAPPACSRAPGPRRAAARPARARRPRSHPSRARRRPPCPRRPRRALECSARPRRPS